MFIAFSGMKSAPPTCSSFPSSNTRASRKRRRTSGTTTALPRDGDPEARPGHPNSIVTDWSVDPEDWGYFLCKVFDEWRQKDLGKVLVNHFETLVSQHMGLGSQICIYGEFCGKGVAVEHDGSVYSCDHYVYPEYRLGNLNDQALDSQVFSRTQVQVRLCQERDPARLLPPMSVSL